MVSADYSPTELMICIAARLMKEARTAFIGTGIPMLAAALAKKLYNPDLIAIFEFGGIGASLEDLPRAVGEARTFYRAMVATGICDVMETAQRGLIEYGFLGGAQIDPYGNLNTTVIGPHEKPGVRLPGSGGANDVGSLCWRTIAIMKHEKKRFVERVDFITTPGYLDVPGARERAGLPAGTGPYRVVTDLALLGYDEATKRMMLLATHPGVTVERVLENTGFALIVPKEVAQSEPPSADELRVLRTEVDPQRLYI
jgi:glutaconate CoA-transferase subunit B